MSDVLFANKIKPRSGKVVEVKGDLVVSSIRVNDQAAPGNSIVPIPVGSIIPFAGRNIPNGFLLCDGKEISRSDYSDLFNIINEDWGEGNGSTTFNIPDLRGVFLRGIGSHGSKNKSNGNAYSGPRLGNYENDQLQSTRRYIDISDRGWPSGSGDRINDYYLMHPVRGTEYRLETPRYDDGINGEPREGDETKPFNAGVNYIIKI